jgi:hypothetical protein
MMIPSSEADRLLAQKGTYTGKKLVPCAPQPEPRQPSCHGSGLLRISMAACSHPHGRSGALVCAAERVGVEDLVRWGELRRALLYPVTYAFRASKAWSDVKPV